MFAYVKTRGLSRFLQRVKMLMMIFFMQKLFSPASLIRFHSLLHIALEFDV
jgi:hypothetical protein